MTFKSLYATQQEERIRMDEQIESRPDVRKLATVKHPNGTILVGDCRDGMRSLPEKSVHCVVTSPPYWGLRDYQVSGQIGLEKSMDEFLSAMVGVFREVRRVLRDDGVCWVNMGDSYNAGTSAERKESRSGAVGRWQREETVGGAGRILAAGLKPKDLCGMPWRLAFALQADGWYLRQDVIWHKPNPMPESVSDRCTKSHEYVFLLTKRPRYWYDAEGIMIRGNENSFELGQRANKRSVWTVPTQGYPGAHFATYPQKLIEPCIIAGCPEQCCPACGAGWIRQLEKVRRPTRPGENTKVKMPDGWDTGEGGHGTFHRNGREAGETRDRAEVGKRDPERHVTETVTVGWGPACKCGKSESVPGTVLDPFGGSGTTAKVAIDLGRRFVLCELNPEYVELIKDRIEQPALF